MLMKLFVKNTLPMAKIYMCALFRHRSSVDKCLYGAKKRHCSGNFSRNIFSTVPKKGTVKHEKRHRVLNFTAAHFPGFGPAPAKGGKL